MLYVVGGLGIAGVILFLLWRSAVKGREVEKQKRAKVEVDRDAWRQVNEVGEKIAKEVSRPKRKRLEAEKARLMKKVEDTPPGTVIDDALGVGGAGDEK